MAQQSAMRIIPVAYQRFLKRSPSSDEPEPLWDELSDPLNFVVGSLLMTFNGRGDPRDTDYARELRFLTRCYRFGGTFWLVVIVALPALAPILWPSLGVGNEFAYAVTLFAAGAITLLPNRLAELRNKQPPAVNGSGYPKTLRKVMLALEWVIVVAALSVVVFWGFGGAANHPNLRAIVWGLLAISATEVYTFYSAVLFAYINEVASEFADREHST